MIKDTPYNLDLQTVHGSIYLPIVLEHRSLHLLAIPSFGRTLKYFKGPQDPILQQDSLPSLISNIKRAPIKQAGTLRLDSGLSWAVTYSIYDMRQTGESVRRPTRLKDLGFDFIPLKTVDHFINEANPSVETLGALLKVISLEIKGP
jgi:hypothetical protein